MFTAIIFCCEVQSLDEMWRTNRFHWTLCFNTLFLKVGTATRLWGDQLLSRLQCEHRWVQAWTVLNALWKLGILRNVTHSIFILIFFWYIPQTSLVQPDASWTVLASWNFPQSGLTRSAHSVDLELTGEQIWASQHSSEPSWAVTGWETNPISQIKGSHFFSRHVTLPSPDEETE